MRCEPIPVGTLLGVVLRMSAANLVNQVRQTRYTISQGVQDVLSVDHHFKFLALDKHRLPVDVPVKLEEESLPLKSLVHLDQLIKAALGVLPNRKFNTGDVVNFPVSRKVN